MAAIVVRPTVPPEKRSRPEEKARAHLYAEAFRTAIIPYLQRTEEFTAGFGIMLADAIWPLAPHAASFVKVTIKTAYRTDDEIKDHLEFVCKYGSLIMARWFVSECMLTKQWVVA